MAYDASVISSVRVMRDDAEMLVTWASTSPIGTLYQVYLDRRRVWCGTALRCKLPWPIARVTIDVGAVASYEGNVDLSASLPALPGVGNRASLAWLGGTYEDASGNDDVAGFRVYASLTAGGSISYTKPVATIPAYEQGSIPLDGFGLGGFGQGGFGRSASNYAWQSGPLGSGVWGFAVRVVDTEGNESAGVTTSITITGPPRPPVPYSDGRRVRYTYNSGTRVPTLTWNASP